MAEAKPSSYACSSECPGVGPDCYIGSGSHYLVKARYQSALCLTPFEAFPHTDNCARYARFIIPDCEGMAPLEMEARIQRSCQNVESNIAKYRSFTLSAMAQKSKCKSSEEQIKIDHALHCVSAFTPSTNKPADDLRMSIAVITQDAKCILRNAKKLARSRREILKQTVERLRKVCARVWSINTRKLDGKMYLDDRCCAHNCVSCNYVDNVSLLDTDVHTYVLRAWRLFRGHVHASSCVYCLIKFFSRLVQCIGFFNLDIVRDHSRLVFVVERLEALAFDINVLLQTPFDLFSMNNFTLHQFMVRTHDRAIETDRFSIEYITGNTPEGFGSAYYWQMRNKLTRPTNCNDCKPLNELDQFLMHRLWKHVAFSCETSETFVKSCFLSDRKCYYTGDPNSVHKLSRKYFKNSMLRLDILTKIEEDFHRKLDDNRFEDLVFPIDGDFPCNYEPIPNVLNEFRPVRGFRLGAPVLGLDEVDDIDEGIEDELEDNEEYVLNGQMIRSPSVDSIFTQGGSSIRKEMQQLLHWRGSKDNRQWMVKLLRSSRVAVLHKAKKIASYVQFDLKDSKDVGQLISAELWSLLTQNKGVDEANARRFAVAIWGNMDPVAPQPQERYRTQGCLEKLNPFRKERTPVDKMTDWLDQNFESLGVKKEYISSLNACVWFIYDVITGVNYSVAILRLLTVGTALTKIVINGARKLYTVLKDCVLKLTGNNKKGLFAQGSEKVLDEATNENLVTSMAGLAYSMFSGKEFDNNLNSKYRLNRVVNLSKFMVSIKNIFSFVTSLITKGFNFLVEVLTGTNEAADDITRTMPEITEWMQRFDKIDASHKDDVQGLQAFAVAIRKSTPLAQEVVALKKMSDKWVTRLSAKFTDARHWSFFMNKYTRFMKYYDIAINAVCTQKIRAAPFVVCLTGRPGIGKSNMYKHLLQNMFAIDKMELDLGKDVFTREITCEYWDGYANQPVVYYSDLLQTCDPDVRTLIAGEFIQMAQTTPYPLHMADCSLKSVSFFDSQLVWTDCNQFPNEGDLAKLVRTPAAFTRRFNHVIEVELIGMRNSSGGFDASQATEAFHPEVYRFSEKNQAYDFRDLVIHLYKSWQQHKYKQSQDMKVMPVMFSEEEMEAIRKPSVRTEGVAKRGVQYRKVFNFTTGKYEEKEDYVHLFKYDKESSNKYEDTSHWILDSDEESEESEGEGIFEQATELLYTLSNPSSSVSSESGSWEDQPGTSRDWIEGSFDQLAERHNPYYYYEDRAAPMTPYEKYLIWSENRKADAFEFVDRMKRLFSNKSVWGFVTAMFLLPVAMSVGWLFPLIDACHSERNQMASHTLKTRIDKALQGAGSMVMKQLVFNWVRQNRVKTALISTFVVLGSVSASVLVYKGVRALFRKRKESLWKPESGETKTQRHDRKIGKLRMQGTNTSPIVIGETDDDQHRHLDANGELVQPEARKPHWHSCIECKGLYSHVHEVVPYEQSKLSGNTHVCKSCKGKKKVTKVPLEEVYSQASHFGESGENALYKIYSAQFKIKSIKSGCYIMGCWVKPHVMMLPAHFFRNEEDAMKDGFFKIFGPNYTLQVHASDLAIREMSLARDICLVSIDQRIMPAKPCIYRFLANSYTVLPLDATLLNPKGFNSEKGGWEMMRHCIDDLSMEYGFQWDPKEHKAMTQVQNGMSYTADTKEGDCGSLVIVRDDTGCPKVVGSHMGSSQISRRAVGTNVDRELVDFLYTKIAGKVISQGSLCLGPIPEKLGLNVPLCGSDEILILGTLPPNLVPNLAKNTKIRGSCLHGLFPVTTAPAMLSLTRGIDPVRNGVKEMCRRNVEMDSNGVADAAVSIGSKLLAMKSPYKAEPRLLTEHETLNGAFLYGTNQPDPYIKKMNMKTSAGWPYSLNSTGGKKNFILGEPGQYTLTEEMRQKVHNLEESLVTPEAIPFLFFDCVKDERRPVEKVEAGMSRIFSVGPMDFTFLMRKYTAQFQAHCMRNCVDCGSAVGINPHSPQWCELLRRLTNKGSNFIAGDYKKWDKWVPYELMMAVCEIMNRFYDKPPDHVDSKIRRALFSGAFGAKRIALSVVYQANGGMPSGTPGTSVFNSLANEILFRYVFEILRQKHCPTLDPGRYHELVAFTAYGDDHILSVSNYLPWFNMISVAEIYSSMGIGYTNADKTDEILRYVPRESLMYLKRKFGEPIGNFCVAPLDPGVIRESVMWERNGSDTFDISCTIRSAMMEMVHHGVEEYLKFRGILAKDLAAQHRVLPDVSYAFVLNRMRDGTMEPEDFLSWRDPDMAIVEEL